MMNQNAIYKAQTGGAQPHIHPRDLSPLVIAIPANNEEQAAIAAVLSDMDAEIATMETKLTKGRQLKTGMMQELLTGRIRLI
jgi:type I restriction enzyme S subunit